MDCMHIPELGCGEFNKRMFAQAIRRRIPVSGSIELTWRCNLRCLHCYINSPQDCQTVRAQELKTREIYTLLDQLTDAGCLQLLITGGEPLIRPDFTDIYAYAVQKGLLTTLFTNATLLTPRLADHLAEHTPFFVEVSLYGRTEQTFERITGIPGSFQSCMNGIELLLQRNIPLRLKSMIMTLNQQEVWEMKAFAEELGVDFYFDAALTLCLDGGRRPQALRLTPREVVALDLQDKQRCKYLQRFFQQRKSISVQSDYLYQCGAGLHLFHIDAFGRLSPCLMSRQPAFDLRQGTFHQGWHTFMPRLRAKQQTRRTSCRNCDLYSLCGQCPGWARMEHGDSETPVEFLCKVTHLRAEMMGLKPKPENSEKADDNDPRKYGKPVMESIYHDGQKDHQPNGQKTLP